MLQLFVKVVAQRERVSRFKGAFQSLLASGGRQGKQKSLTALSLHMYQKGWLLIISELFGWYACLSCSWSVSTFYRIH